MSITDKLKCGLLMPISSVALKPGLYSEMHWENVKQMITDSIEKTNLFIAVPIWEDNSSDQIKETIYRNLVSVDMAVCDISTLNANVMFELGLRLSLRKPLVIICDDQTTPPFDINDIRYVSPKYPVGLNMYVMPKYQENLCNVIKSTWERFTNDKSNFTQLAQLKPQQKTLIIDDDGQKIKYSDAISDILEIVTRLSKSGPSKSTVVSPYNGTDILQFREDLQTFKGIMDNFIEKIRPNIDQEDIEEFLDDFRVCMDDLNKFVVSIERDHTNENKQGNRIYY